MAEWKKIRILIRDEEQVTLAAKTHSVICFMANPATRAVEAFYEVPSDMREIVQMLNALDTMREQLVSAAAKLGYEQLKNELAEDDEEDDSDD